MQLERSETWIWIVVTLCFLPLTRPLDIGKPISLTGWGTSPVADELSHRSKPNLLVLPGRGCGVEWQWPIVSSCNEAPHS